MNTMKRNRIIKRLVEQRDDLVVQLFDDAWSMQDIAGVLKLSIGHVNKIIRAEILKENEKGNRN